MTLGEHVSVPELAWKGRMVVREVRESWGADRPFWRLAPIHNEGSLGTRTSSTGRFDRMVSSGDVIIVRMNIKISFGEPVSGSVRRQAGGQGVWQCVCGGGRTRKEKGEAAGVSWSWARMRLSFARQGYTARPG